MTITVPAVTIMACNVTIILGDMTTIVPLGDVTITACDVTIATWP